MSAEQERDPGEFGGDEAEETEGEPGDTVSGEDKSIQKQTKRQHRAADRNAALLLIVRQLLSISQEIVILMIKSPESCCLYQHLFTKHKRKV